MRKLRRKLGRKLGPLALVAIAAVGAVLTAGTAVVTTHGTCSFDGWDISCDIGDLAPGEKATVKVTVAPTMAGLIKNTAVATSDTHDPTPENNMDMEETEVIDPQPDPKIDLSLMKDGPSMGFLGEQYTYTLRVANAAGSDTATNVMVKDRLPMGVDFIAARGADCNVGFGGVECMIDKLEPGEGVVIEIDVMPNNVGNMINNACVMSMDRELRETNPDNNCDDASTQVKEREADLWVEKSDDKDPVKVGEEVTYTVEIMNHGPDTATNVVLKDWIKQPLD